MKSKFQIVCLILLFASNKALACDLCGAFDYSTISKYSFVSVNYQYSLFNGYSHLSQPANFSFSPQNQQKHLVNTKDYTTIPSERDYELSQQIELRANLQLGKDWTVRVGIPYFKNDEYYSLIVPSQGPGFDTVISQNGIGDINLHLLNWKSINNEMATHKFAYGLGITLPTGRFDLSENELSGDPAQLPGSGAINLIFSGTYIGTYRSKYGSLSRTQFRLSTKNRQGSSLVPPNGNIRISAKNYRFGNQFLSENYFFYVFKIKKFKIIPMLGAGFYWQQYDVTNNEPVPHTGYSSVYLNGNVDIRFKNYTISNAIGSPIFQDREGEQLNAAGIYTISLIYNFNYD